MKKMKKTKKNNPLRGKEELARLDRLDRFIWHPDDLRMIEEAGRGSNELGKSSKSSVRKRNQKSKTLSGTRKKAGNKESK